MSTMSTGNRKYELKARAEAQRETRERIARCAAELHEEIGVARTTVAEIARRAGVTRLTVYNHFPNLDALLPACAEHYESRHPRPVFDTALSRPQAEDRVSASLELLYRWYRETESLHSKAFTDRAAVPELDRLLADGVDLMQQELVRGIEETLDTPNDDQRVMLRLAVDFWTWYRLSRQGLDDVQASDLMARVVLK